MDTKNNIEPKNITKEEYIEALKTVEKEKNIKEFKHSLMVFAPLFISLFLPLFTPLFFSKNTSKDVILLFWLILNTGIVVLIFIKMKKNLENIVAWLGGVFFAVIGLFLGVFLTAMQLS